MCRHVLIMTCMMAGDHARAAMFPAGRDADQALQDAHGRVPLPEQLATSPTPRPRSLPARSRKCGIGCLSGGKKPWPRDFREGIAALRRKDELALRSRGQAKKAFRLRNGSTTPAVTMHRWRDRPRSGQSSPRVAIRSGFVGADRLVVLPRSPEHAPPSGAASITGIEGFSGPYHASSRQWSWLCSGVGKAWLGVGRVIVPYTNCSPKRYQSPPVEPNTSETRPSAVAPRGLPRYESSRWPPCPL